MRIIRTGFPALTLALLFIWLAQGAIAQVDPPDRVARLNLIEGAVSYLPSGGQDNDWVAASLNRPLTTGDRLWADANSRSELHIGSTAIRMDSNTGISFLNLDDTTVQIRLSDGAMIVRLRGLDPGNSFEVDTPNLAFTINRPGDYRLETDPNSNRTAITVRQGEGEVVGGGRSWQVISDQQAIFTGTDVLDYDLKDADAQPLTDFDKWARSRDAHEDSIAAPRYVSAEMTGYEDLDAYGRWINEPGYGWCWGPAGVQAGWAPYRYGHWVWVAPWGWTWVEDEPWGFAPFHYGRWAYFRASWFWVPGPIAVRPVYAPALVAWIGGGGFGLSLNVGSGIGWFPLGPREVFVPGYHVSERYVTNINITNTVVDRVAVINAYRGGNVQSITYVNRAAPNAIAVVSRETFVNARPVARNIASIPSQSLAAAPVARSVQAVPERASVYGPGNHNAPHPPAQLMNRPVVAKRVPPAAPNHFDQPRQQATPADRPPNRTGTQQIPPSRVEPQQKNQTVPNQPNPSVEKSQPQQPQPLARPAPAVRPPTAKEQSDTAAKQKAWQNAHPRNDQPPAKKKVFLQTP